MKKAKPPVLTSPSKIGFLVSLVVVFVSIGVAHLVTRRFGISWKLLEHEWLNRNEWLGIIRGEGFLFEMLPIVGLVAVTSMFAYLVITGAVRNYKRYLDSGHDYRNLLSSLKDLEDLEDKRKIERIKNHPELKRLLLGLVDTFEERERLLSEREGALETRLQDALRAKEAELAESFSHECERLVKAVEDGTVQPSAIGFSNPGLRRLGEILEGAARRTEPPRQPDLVESYGDLRKTSDVLHSRLREFATELRTSCEGAQEVEARLRGLASREQGETGKARSDAARKEIKTIVAALKSIEQVNLTIDALSEEARGVAINTALHAGSGVGTQDDLIRLAEEVKELAARFKDAARQFAQTSSAVRASVGILDTVAGAPGDQMGRSAQPEESLTSVLSRVSLWVERVVVLADKVSNFEQSYDVSVSSLRDTRGEPAAERTEPERSRAEEMAPGEESGFESLERSQSLFGETGESPFEEPGTTWPRDRGIFEEIPPGARRPYEIPDAEAAPAEGTSAEPEERPDEAPPAPADQGFSETEEPSETLATEGEGTEEKVGEEPRADEEAVDLYALGAVDYDPALHA